MSATDFTYKGKKYQVENKGRYVLVTTPSGHLVPIKSTDEINSWTDPTFRYKLHKAYKRVNP